MTIEITGEVSTSMELPLREAIIQCYYGWLRSIHRVDNHIINGYWVESNTPSTSVKYEKATEKEIEIYSGFIILLNSV